MSQPNIYPLASTALFFIKFSSTFDDGHDNNHSSALISKILVINLLIWTIIIIIIHRFALSTYLSKATHFTYFHNCYLKKKKHFGSITSVHPSVRPSVCMFVLNNDSFKPNLQGGSF